MSCPVNPTEAKDPFDSGWLTVTNTCQLQSGDIFETPSKIPSFSPILPGTLVNAVKHVGMICRLDNGQLFAAHSPFGKFPVLEPYEEVFKDRPLERIIRTGTSTEQILSRLEAVKHHRYSFFSWNCEDLCRYLCGCATGKMDQRIGYTIVLLIFIILILLLLVVKK